MGKLRMIMKKSLILVLLFTVFTASQAVAQCSMCRSTLEGNTVRGETTVSAFLNIGIMYLFLLPYVAFAVIGFMWYRKSRKNVRTQQARLDRQRKVSSL